MRLLRLAHRAKWSACLFLAFSCSSPVDYQLSYTWSPVEINTEVAESEQIEAIISPYRVKMDSMMGEVIGYAAHDLTTEGAYESTLGTFVTELLVKQSMLSFDQKVDVAIMNHHGGLRAPINQGAITLGEVFEVMPFENETILLEIPGDSLTKVIQFIGQSGRSMIWPASFQVSESGVSNILVNGQDVEPEKIYILSVSDYLANGGSGFYMLKDLKRVALEPVKIRDMIIQEIRQQSAKGDSIDTQIVNNITVLTP